MPTPPKPTGISSTVSKRQNNTRAYPTSSAGKRHLRRAALSPSRSHAASGVASRRRRRMTAYPCLARAGEDIAFRFGCTIDGAGLGFNRRSARRRSVRLRRPWRATHENAGSVAPVDLGIHVFEHHDAAVKGKDFTILHARRAARRADIVLA